MLIELTNPKITVEIFPESKTTCKEPTCKKEIYWATNPETKKRIPVSRTPEGGWISHFKDCTKPNKF